MNKFEKKTKINEQTNEKVWINKKRNILWKNNRKMKRQRNFREIHMKHKIRLKSYDIMNHTWVYVAYFGKKPQKMQSSGFLACFFRVLVAVSVIQCKKRPFESLICWERWGSLLPRVVLSLMLFLFNFGSRLSRRRSMGTKRAYVTYFGKKTQNCSVLGSLPVFFRVLVAVSVIQCKKRPFESLICWERWGS